MWYFAKRKKVIYSIGGRMKLGDYFVMSMKFDKCDASDFGLVSNNSNTAIDPKDNSIWIKASLYDFGWGKENGFYKTPLPSFDILFELALHSTNKDDRYGAAAVILEKFPDELLSKCELFMNDCSREKEFKKLVELFDLRLPINRCFVVQKTYSQIENDCARWRKVSETAKKFKNTK